MSTLKIQERFRADAFFYVIGKWIWIPAVLAGFWFAKTGFQAYGYLFTCSIRAHTGIPCLSCGGTRALYYLLKGDILKSLVYNPIVVYGALAYLHFMVLFFYRKHIAGTITEKKITIEIYIYLGVAVLILQWLVGFIYI